MNRFSLLLALASGFFIAAVVAAFTIGWFAPIACAILGTATLIVALLSRRRSPA